MSSEIQPLNLQNDTSATIAKYSQYVNPTFIELLGIFGYGRVFARAQDVWLWDAKGQKYLDFLAGFGSVNIGHNHPRLIQKLKEALEQNSLNFCHISPCAQTAELAEFLASIVARPLEISLFSNSGAEAVEAGMKLARAATKREGFVYCKGGFHGTNLGVLSIMGQPRMRKPFEPLLSSCTSVPFGDIEALQKVLSLKKSAGFIVEPVQGEAGVIFPPPHYLQDAQSLCHRYGTLLILDEVQTGLGRTGTMFAYESREVIPDILVLAKSLSGAIAPIAATITSRDIYKKAYGSIDRFDLHSSTFGGNAFSCVSALETIKIIQEEKLCENSALLGKEMLELLRGRLLHHPLVRDIRGQGLFIAIELGPTDSGWMNKLAPWLVSMISQKAYGQWVTLRLLEKGIICQTAAHQWNVVKLEPPLTIRKAEVEEGVQKVVEVLEEYQSLPPILYDVAKRIAEQFGKGWSFE